MINRLSISASTLLMGMMLLFSLLTACQTAPSRWQDSVREQIQQDLNAVQQSQPATATAESVPMDINQALLPPIRVTLPEGGVVPLEPRFDLSANDTPSRQVFMSIVEGTPYSAVVHPSVDGKITLHLKDVTVDEAFKTLRQVYGYEYRRDGNRYYILGQGLQTRLFPVNYLNFNRKGRSNTRVSSGELTQASSGSEDSSSANNGNGSQPHGIQVETATESDFWKELTTALQAIIGSEEGRRVVVHPQAGLVIVKAMPDELALVEDYLGITQATVNRQVILEAKVIEVELKDSFQTGINWANLGRASDVNYFAAQTGGGTLFAGSNISEIAGAKGNLQPDSNFDPIASGATSAFGGIFSLAIKTPDFAAFLELLSSQGDVHVLSSPRVSTVNNQKAVIKVGGDEFFVTGITNQTATSGSTTTQSPTVELKPFFSGIALDVTPQIDSDGNIVLHIHPTVSNVSQRDKNFVVNGENFNLPLANSTIQESDNVVRAKSTQIIVIGGLMKEASSEEYASIPLLGDIPVVGNLFRHQKLSRIKKELVILLKPTIVDGGMTWSDSIQVVQEHAAQIKRASAR